MHDFLKKPKRTHVKEIPLAPLLDLLTVVIFFLILSTSFMEIRQNILPPSSTIAAAPIENNDNKTVPINPKLIMYRENNYGMLLLKWGGENPGELRKKVNLTKDGYDFVLKNNVRDLIKEFREKYPSEKTLQLGWQSKINYQTVLTVVDGVLVELRDLVFISPEEAESLIRQGDV